MACCYYCWWHYYDTGKLVEFQADTDPHLVAGLLKCWLCNLSAPLLTFELNSAFIEATSMSVCCICLS